MSRAFQSLGLGAAAVPDVPMATGLEVVDDQPLQAGVARQRIQIDVAPPVEGEEQRVLVPGDRLAVEPPAPAEPRHVGPFRQAVDELRIEQPAAAVEVGGRILREVPAEEAVGAHERGVDRLRSERSGLRDVRRQHPVAASPGRIPLQVELQSAQPVEGAGPDQAQPVLGVQPEAPVGHAGAPRPADRDQPGRSSRASEGMPRVCCQATTSSAVTIKASMGSKPRGTARR